MSALETDVNSLKSRVSTLESSGGSSSGGDSGGSSSGDGVSIQVVSSLIADEMEERQEADSELDNRISRIESKTANLGSLANYSIQMLTQAEYIALPTKDSHTLYFIMDEGEVD